MTPMIAFWSAIPEIGIKWVGDSIKGLDIAKSKTSEGNQETYIN